MFWGLKCLFVCFNVDKGFWRFLCGICFAWVLCMDVGVQQKILEKKRRKKNKFYQNQPKDHLKITTKKISPSSSACDICCNSRSSVKSDLRLSSSQRSVNMANGVETPKSLKRKNMNSQNTSTTKTSKKTSP